MKIVLKKQDKNTGEITVTVEAGKDEAKLYKKDFTFMDMPNVDFRLIRRRIQNELIQTKKIKTSLKELEGKANGIIPK